MNKSVENNTSTHGAAIATTVADGYEHLDFFIRYHLAIGFEHIFVFVDDNCEKSLDLLANYEQVTAFPRDQMLEQMWTLVPIYKDHNKRAIIKEEVMARQELNIFVAEARAKFMGLQWLLHIDMDELFYLNGHSLEEHLSKLKSDGSGSCCYLNYEAIPYRADLPEGEAYNIFNSTHYFKKNFFKNRHWFYSNEQKQYMEKNSDWLPKLYFNYYQNGKSIARLSGEFIVEDVHAIKSTGYGAKLGSHGDPIILHFPCATYREFEKKYKRLDKFGDLWKGKERAGKFIDRFHLQSRDLYTSGDIEGFKQHYADRMLLTEERIEELIQQDLALAINFPREIFSNLDNEITPPSNDKQYLARSCDLNYTGKNQHEGTELSLADLYKDLSRVELCINFSTLGSARLWLRRHPQLKNEENTEIRELSGGGFFPILNGTTLVDLEKDAFTCAINDYVNALTDVQSLLLPDLEELFYEDYQGLSEITVRVKRISLVAQLLASLPDESLSKCCIRVGGAYDKYLISLHAGLVARDKKLKVLDTELADSLLSSIKEKSSYQFALYIQGRYPRTPIFEWLVSDITEEQTLSNEQAKTFYPCLLSLGGGFFKAKREKGKAEEFVQNLLNLRESYPIIYREYARPLLSEHESLVVLKKEENTTRFLSITNITGDEALLSSTQIIKHGLTGEWKDLISNETYDLKQDLFISPYQSLWLITQN